MKKDLSKFYYEQELVALIKSGVEPDKAKKIADEHLASGIYDEVLKQVAKERQKDEKHQAYARILTARIRGGENPQDVVKDMKNFEREK